MDADVDAGRRCFRQRTVSDRKALPAVTIGRGTVRVPFSQRSLSFLQKPSLFSSHLQGYGESTCVSLTEIMSLRKIAPPSRLTFRLGYYECFHSEVMKT